MTLKYNKNSNIDHTVTQKRGLSKLFNLLIITISETIIASGFLLYFFLLNLPFIVTFLVILFSWILQGYIFYDQVKIAVVSVICSAFTAFFVLYFLLYLPITYGANPYVIGMISPLGFLVISIFIYPLTGLLGVILGGITKSF